MTNSERITANNTRLAVLVETAESLPDAGSGGGSITYAYWSGGADSFVIFFEDGWTWQDYISSPYNHGFAYNQNGKYFYEFVESGVTYIGRGYYAITPDGTLANYVKLSDAIVPGTTYAGYYVD